MIYVQSRTLSKHSINVKYNDWYCLYLCREYHSIFFRIYVDYVLSQLFCTLNVHLPVTLLSTSKSPLFPHHLGKSAANFAIKDNSKALSGRIMETYLGFLL